MVIVTFGVMLLIPNLLVVGAAKRNSCLLMAWLILIGMVILCCVIALFKEVGDAKIIVRNLFGLGLAIWMELVGIGGYQEVTNSA